MAAVTHDKAVKLGLVRPIACQQCWSFPCQYACRHCDTTYYCSRSCEKKHHPIHVSCCQRLRAADWVPSGLRSDSFERRLASILKERGIRYGMLKVTYTELAESKLKLKLRPDDLSIMNLTPPLRDIFQTLFQHQKSGCIVYVELAYGHNYIYIYGAEL